MSNRGAQAMARYGFLYLIKCPRERGLALGLWPLCAFGAGAKPRAAASAGPSRER